MNNGIFQFSLILIMCIMGIIIKNFITTLTLIVMGFISICGIIDIILSEKK
jgi:hypothetical protein